MRLIQIARKLQRTQTEIADYLKSQGVDVTGGSHTRIKPEHIQLISRKYGIDLMQEEVVEQTVPADSDKTVDSVAEEDIKSADTIEAPEADPSSAPNSLQEQSVDNIPQPEEEEEEEEEVEVIRPKLVKLEGVKVVGKIDLPEPPTKKKEEKSTDEAAETSDKSPEDENTSRRRRNGSKKIQKKSRRKTHTPLSYEERLKREEDRKIRQQKAALRKKKEKKYRHYYKNVQSKLQRENLTKTADTKETEPAKTTEKPTYKNPVKRFWAWLSGAYDDF